MASSATSNLTAEHSNNPKSTFPLPLGAILLHTPSYSLDTIPPVDHPDYLEYSRALCKSVDLPLASAPSAIFPPKLNHIKGFEQAMASSSTFLAPLPSPSTHGPSMSQKHPNIAGIRRSGRERKSTAKAQEASESPLPKKQLPTKIKLNVKRAESHPRKRKADTEKGEDTPTKKAKTKEEEWKDLSHSSTLSGPHNEVPDSTIVPATPKVQSPPNMSAAMKVPTPLKFSVAKNIQAIKKVSFASNVLKAAKIKDAAARRLVSDIPTPPPAAVPMPPIHDFLKHAELTHTTNLYFGYGQDLSRTFMESQYRGVKFHHLAVLDGWMWTPNGEGIPTIEPCTQKVHPKVHAQVWGFVYSVDHRSQINHFAGPRGHLGENAMKEFVLEEVTVLLKGNHKKNLFTRGLDPRPREEVEQELKVLTFVDKVHLEGDGRDETGRWNEKVTMRLNRGIVDAFMEGMSSKYEEVVLRKRANLPHPTTPKGLIW